MRAGPFLSHIFTRNQLLLMFRNSKLLPTLLSLSSRTGASTMPIQFTRKGSFTATDAALRLYDVVITQECVHSDNPAYIPQQFLHTAEGEPVTRRRKGQYVLARTGKLLRSRDPCCP
jgi:hypothetical protein